MQTQSVRADPASPLDHLIRQVERRAGSAMLTIQRPRPGQYHATLFRDDQDPKRVLYVTAAGDSMADALHDLLEDPRTLAATP